MAERVKAQLALDETIVEDAELEAALEKRLRAADDVAEVRKVFEAADVEVKAGLERIGLLSTDQVVRIGRFRVSKVEIPARAVSFESKASERISIKLAEDE